MWYFWLGGRGNLKLVTFASERAATKFFGTKEPNSGLCLAWNELSRPNTTQTPTRQKKMSGSEWRSLTIYGYWQADVWWWTTRRTLTASLSPAWHSMARLFICDIRSQVNVWPVSGSVFGLKMEKGKPKRQTNTDLTSVHDINIWFRG